MHIKEKDFLKKWEAMQLQGKRNYLLKEWLVKIGFLKLLVITVALSIIYHDLSIIHILPFTIPLVMLSSYLSGLIFWNRFEKNAHQIASQQEQL